MQSKVMRAKIKATTTNFTHTQLNERRARRVRERERGRECVWGHNDDDEAA